MPRRPAPPAKSPLAVMQRIAGAIFLSAMGLLACAQSTQAENWTRFRGPNGTGHAGEVTFASQWSEQDYLWKIALPGVGHSSPVGWENYLFLTSGNVETGAVTLHCFNAGSGDVVWQREFPGTQYAIHSSNSYAATTPTVDEQRVYMTWATEGKMHCVALTHQGDEVWRRDLGQFVGDHGFAASPIVVEGVVCLQVDQAEDGFLAGIDAVTGQVRWRAKRPAGKATYATPCVVSIAGGPITGGPTAVVSQSTSGGMQAIAVETGELLWQLADAFPERCVSSPLVAGDWIFGACGSGGSGKQLVGVRVPKKGVSKKGTDVVGAVKMRLTKHVPYVPTPLVKGDWLFLWHDQGKVTCTNLRAEDPSEFEWTKRVGGKFFGSPILAGDKIYCLSIDGRAFVLAADPEYALLGETDLGDPTHATPAVHQGKMYLRTESSLACLPAQQ